MRSRSWPRTSDCLSRRPLINASGWLFGIEIEACARCGGKLAIIASIAEPEVIAQILAHLQETAPDRFQGELPLGARAPPSQASLL